MDDIGKLGVQEGLSDLIFDIPLGKFMNQVVFDLKERWVYKSNGPRISRYFN